MHSEILKFEKSFEERIEEYTKIFSKAKSYTSCAEIQDIWADYLDDYIESVDWTAMWNISRELCLKYSVIFPRSVCVTVSKINFDSLTADISIESIEQKTKTELPQKITSIPLKDLYVLKNQKVTDNDFYIVGNCLDQLRVFYDYLWWPWDEELVQEPSYWISNHLVFRLELYYDILEENLNETTIKNILALIEKGRRLYAKFQTLPQISEVVDFSDDENNLKNVMDMYNELEIIKKKLQRWENTMMRKLLNCDIQKRKNCSHVHIVFPKRCSVSETARIFSEAAKLLPSRKTKFPGTNLKCLLSEYNSEDIILISAGNHFVGNERLDFDLRIRSLYEEQKSVISDDTSHWYFLKTTADNLTLQNIGINVKTCSVAIVVKEGITYLDSVAMKNENTQKSNAVIVEDKATLVATRCKFTDFDIAIICLPGSAVQLTDCVFENNNISVEVIHGAQLCLSNCDMSSSKKVPIRYNGNSNSEQFQSLDSLSSVENVSICSVSVNDNEKAVEFL